MHLNFLKNTVGMLLLKKLQKFEKIQLNKLCVIKEWKKIEEYVYLD